MPVFLDIIKITVFRWINADVSRTQEGVSRYTLFESSLGKI